MKKNKLLNIAVIVCKSIRIFIIIAFIGLTTIFIHLQISPESYKKGNIEFKVSGLQISKSNRWKISNSGDDKEVYALNKITKTSLFINYLKFSAVLFFMFLLITEFQKIMQSVKNLNTFQKNNVRSFRKIGKYLFIIFLLSSYFKLRFQQGGMTNFSLNFTPLIFMLIAFILAEIFKEGNLLQRENDLTI
ncbi:DUF2975 domain-containing protein [Polaribacter sp. AHE13PA]|jgi:hypothetical protein|uniref:DUF2975 domain-containing protein n=1 Tax=unclassified Polaribacter TaxID=196858 RepID=UPI001C4F563F|nr:DUF2975 domain-containing protein [Polaribacter sp. AHE13PA]QXP66023.1 DUF2975 domain-containing protein [Polaribacter sp. AHE13PA]